MLKTDHLQKLSIINNIDKTTNNKAEHIEINKGYKIVKKVSLQFISYVCNQHTSESGETIGIDI
jgi:hypothetical protein